MAIIRIHDRVGSGFDMSDVRNGTTFFSTYDAESPAYLGSYRYDYDTDYDIYRYGDGSTVGVFYRDGYGGVVVESMYYSDRAGASTLDMYGIDVFISYADLYSDDTFWRLDFLRGDDRLIGNRFGDIAKGGYGDDQIFGKGGNDRLYGEAGSDRLVGGSGKDRLDGGGRNDRLEGGAYADRLKGGSGSDLFVFRKASDSAGKASDRIEDFAGAGQRGGDRIDLSAIDAVIGRTGNQAFDFGKGTGRGDLWAENYRGDTLILGNTDGDRFAETRIVIEDGARVSAADYVAGDFIL